MGNTFAILYLSMEIYCGECCLGKVEKEFTIAKGLFNAVNGLCATSTYVTNELFSFLSDSEARSKCHIIRKYLTGKMSLFVSATLKFQICLFVNIAGG